MSSSSFCDNKLLASISKSILAWPLPCSMQNVDAFVSQDELKIIDAVKSNLRTTPATAAGVTKRLWEMADIVDVLEAWEAANA
jgi:hypothetical protein